LDWVRGIVAIWFECIPKERQIITFKTNEEPIASNIERVKRKRLRA
jgi:hypothetical protein